MDRENSVPKQRGRPFQPGQSGNPAGKPKGARNRSTIAAEALLDGEAKALTRKAIELALGGDTAALRLCMERLLPPRKDRPISLELPPIASAGDVAKAVRAVLAAVAEGRITLSEAGEVMGLIELCRRTVAPEAPPATLVRVTFAGAGETGQRGAA
ncbi:DUF5681 domain-containing protein [Rhodoblastus sp.]|uniref:DUF5681 domain-containing protein n=1 Tax=Rhodoblastus sp. TaxID=1962975 RepID=UPI003F999BA4